MESPLNIALLSLLSLSSTLPRLFHEVINYNAITFHLQRKKLVKTNYDDVMRSRKCSTKETEQMKNMRLLKLMPIFVYRYTN